MGLRYRSGGRRRWRSALVAALVVASASAGHGPWDARAADPPAAARVVRLVQATAALPAAGAVPASAGAPSASARWAWPLHPVPAVAREFQAPPSPWSPGHRGVDLLATVGQPVTAPADGVVTFAGVVVGRGVLTIGHAEGLRTSYEPVLTHLAAGAPVRRGDVVAHVGPWPGHCVPATCLHWGLRLGRDYLDPLARVRPAEPPVLLPLWGGRGRGVLRSQDGPGR